MEKNTNKHKKNISLKGSGKMLPVPFNNILRQLAFIWKQVTTRLLQNINLSPKEKMKVEDTTAYIDSASIYTEMYNSATDEIAELVISISKKYKLSQYSTPLALKIIELVKKHGGFNLQARKEFYLTAPSIFFNLFRSQEGLAIINQAISILVESVDAKMAQARRGVDQGNSPVAQKATENILKLCDLLIKSEQAARKALEEVKTSLVARKHPMAIC